MQGRRPGQGCLPGAEGEDRLYNVRGRLGLWTGLALFNHHFSFLFISFLGCFLASLPRPLCVKCFVAFGFWHACRVFKG